MRTVPVSALCLFLLAACAAPPPSAPPARAEDEAVVRAVAPVLNATFPYRTEVNPDPKDPLGTRRVPTDKVVVAAVTDKGYGVSWTAERLPGQDALFGAWKTANEQPVRWTDALLESPGLIPFDRVNAKIEGNWWTGLATVAPMASAKVTFSRPAYEGDRAVVSAAVETDSARFDIVYLLARDGGAWVVTNSATR